MRNAKKPDLNAVFDDRETMEVVLSQAVREAVLRHKRLGQSIVIWRDGKVVEVPPEEIPDDGSPIRPSWESLS